MLGLSFRWSIPVFYAALFSAYGIYMPFMPVWLAGRGLAAWQISLCLALPMVSRLLMPLSGFLADRAGSRRNVILTLLAAAFLVGFGLHFAQGFVAILLFMLAWNLVWNPVLPITEAFAVHEAEQRGADYGRWRFWGSASFVLLNAAGGLLLTGRPTDLIVPLMLGLILLALAAAWFLPTAGGPRAGSVRFADVGRLLRQPGLVAFMLGAGLIQASHGLYYSFSSVHWVAKAYPGWLIGALWATGVLAETALFWVAGRVTARHGAVHLALLGGGMACLRWMAMAFEPPVAGLFGLQLLHAGSFALTHLATMKFIREQVPPDLAATGQGTFTAISAGLLTGIVMFASGPLYAGLSGLAFLPMALIALCGVVALFSPKVRLAAAA